MPLVQTRGAASAQGFGEFAQAAPAANYIEDVFSTYLYTGNGSTQTITNGIDLAGKGGLVWIKNRFNTGGTYTASHNLYDTVRGMNYTAAQRLLTDTTDAQVSQSNFIRADATGFSLGTSATGAMVNGTSNSYCSWTFREQAKFFDVVTWTGNGSNRTIAHNLGSVPGCIIVKRTDAAGYGWPVYHRSIGASQALELQITNAAFASTTYWNSTAPTSAVFSIGTDSYVNASGGTYVAYLFAHDAGGFGTAGTDNVISCGSYTGNGTDPGPIINIGFEPQWLMVKNITAAADWIMYDVMRGMPSSTNTGATKFFRANLANAEAGGFTISPTATGFQLNNVGSPANFLNDQYIYIAIRRGPMKTPTSGTSVHNAAFGSSTTVGYTAGFPVDLAMTRDKVTTSFTWATSKLTGQMEVYTNSTSAESDGGTNTRFDFMTGWHFPNQTADRISWMFKRAPGFMDVVCYTGTGSTTTITHNLGVTPELVITKSRTNGSLGWVVWTTSLTSTSYWIRLDDTMAQANSPVGYGGTFSASNYTIANTGPYDALNGSGQNYVAYLFATVAGVSKVGSYTGNGGTQAIACGFTGGARFVLIKRTDSTGDWYVYDTARGMTLLTDPYLRLNSTAAETATLGSVTTTTGGFTVDATILAAINTNTASYIFLAIA